MLKYILDKYINEDKPNDYIEAYEAQLLEKATLWKENEVVEMFFATIYLEDEYDMPTLIYLAAVNYFIVLLTSIPKNVREQYYDLIKNKSIRELTLNILTKL